MILEHQAVFFWLHAFEIIDGTLPVGIFIPVSRCILFFITCTKESEVFRAEICRYIVGTDTERFEDMLLLIDVEALFCCALDDVAEKAVV